MTGRALTLLALLALSAALTGCGDVAVRGSFGGRTLDVTGTAWGWLDTTEYVVDAGGGTPVLRVRNSDDVLLHLVFSQAVFDPLTDFRTLPPGERAAIEDDIARGDELELSVRRGNVLRAGDHVPFVDAALPPEVLPFIESLDVSFGTPVVSADAGYPARAPRLGGKRTAELVVDQVAPQLTGTLTLGAKRAAGENDGFLEGSVDVAFQIELLPERLAECNFAPAGAGAVDPCTLDDAPGAGP